MLVGDVRTDAQPVAKDRTGFLPQRQDAFPPTFSHHMDLIEARLLEVTGPKPDQFRHAQAGVVRQMQHRTVPNAAYGVWVGRVKQGLQFLAVEMADQRHIPLLLWDCVHAPGKIEACRFSEIQENGRTT